MSRVRAIRRLTDNRWINLYEAHYLDRHGQERTWTFASRRPSISPELIAHPDDDDERADAVVVVPILVGPGAGERRLVMIREYRVPIRAHEYGFPAGLTEADEPYEETARRELREETGLEVTRVLRVTPRLYASPGMVDEAAVMVFVECTGTPSTHGTEATEDIEVLVLEWADVCRITDDASLRVSAKAWPILYLYQQLGHL